MFEDLELNNLCSIIIITISGPGYAQILERPWFMHYTWTKRAVTGHRNPCQIPMAGILYVDNIVTEWDSEEVTAACDSMARGPEPKAIINNANFNLPELGIKKLQFLMKQTRNDGIAAESYTINFLGLHCDTINGTILISHFRY